MPKALRTTQELAALAGLGFQRVDASPIPPASFAVSGNRHRVTSASPSMGTLVSVTAVHASRDLIDDSVGAAFEEMDRVVALLNRYDPSSAVSVLNDLGSIDAPPPELSIVLGRALEHHRSSRGTFDPTVQPLVDRYWSRTRDPGFDLEHTILPNRNEVRELLALVDANAVHLTPRSIRLGKEGMGVTLDGIAKGYVVDLVANSLTESGLLDFIVDAGGDIRSSGIREDGDAWRVAVQDPGKTGDFPDVIPLDGAVATSGSYEVFFDPGQTHHHIVDSKAGSSPVVTRSVSVVAPTAMEADALATTVFLMEPDRGSAFIDSIPGCACLFVDRHGRQFRSARWRSDAESPTPKAEMK